MSKYTTQIRFICESAVPLEQQGDGSDVNLAIQSGRSKLFDFDYDLFLDTYKDIIEAKFIRHNYTREIGFETVGLFKLRLQDEWIMKLPYYNKLWESNLLTFDPFVDVDYKTQHTGSGTVERNDTTSTTNSGRVGETGTTESQAKGNRNELNTQSVKGSADDSEAGVENNSKSNKQVTDQDTSNTRREDLLQKYSDTPQGGLNGVIDTDWLTNATQNSNTIIDTGTNDVTVNGVEQGVGTRNTTRKQNNKTDGTGTSNIITIDDNYAKAIRDVVSNNIGSVILDGDTVSSETYLRRVWGKYNSRSYSKALMEFRETFLNIDEMFINEFRKLFMLIY